MIKQRNLDSLNKMNVNIYVLKLKNFKDWVMGERYNRILGIAQGGNLIE